MLLEQHKANFQTLLRACTNNDVALMDCRVRSTGEKVAVICAVEFDGDMYTFKPFAQLLNDNPYELIDPPDPDGGYVKPEQAGR